MRTLIEEVLVPALVLGGLLAWVLWGWRDEAD